MPACEIRALAEITIHFLRRLLVYACVARQSHTPGIPFGARDCSARRNRLPQAGATPPPALARLKIRSDKMDIYFCAGPYPPIWKSLISEFRLLPVPSILGSRGGKEIRKSAISKFNLEPRLLVERLSFAHLVKLISISDPLKRAFYEIEFVVDEARGSEGTTPLGSSMPRDAKTPVGNDSEKNVNWVQEKKFDGNSG